MYIYIVPLNLKLLKMDRIERQCRLGAKVTGTWGTRFGFTALTVEPNRRIESQIDASTSLQETSDPWTTDLHRAGFGARSPTANSTAFSVPKAHILTKC